MNVIVFSFRLLLGVISFLFALMDYTEKHWPGCIASLAMAILILFPVIKLYYKHQPVEPLSALKAHFDFQRGFAWGRFMAGYFVTLGTIGNIDTPHEDPPMPGMLIIGYFLLSPLGNSIFTHKRGATWDVRAALLVITRTFGIILIMFSIYSYYNKIKEWPPEFFFIGVLLLCSRQIWRLIRGKKEAPAPAVEMAQAVVPQTGQTIAAVPALPIAAPINPLFSLKNKFAGLYHLSVEEKGPVLQEVLNKLFSHFSIPHRHFQLFGKDLSGHFELEGQHYILNARWEEKPCDYNDLLIFNGKIEARSAWARGILINLSGFTREAVETFAQGKRTSMIGMDGEDLQLVLDNKLTLPEAIQLKARKAAESNRSFVPLSQLI